MQSRTRRYLIAVVLLTAGLALTQAARALRGAQARYHPDFRGLPEHVLQYEAHEVAVDELTQQYLQPQAMRKLVYQYGDDQISLSIIYGINWRSIHAPTSCLPAQGWTIVHNQVIAVPAPNDCPHPGPLHGRQVYAIKNQNQQVSILVYARPGATTANWTSHALHMALGTPGMGGVIIILTRPISGGDWQKQAYKLRQFLRAIYTDAVAFWYD